MKQVYGGPFDGGTVDWTDELVCVKTAYQYHVYLQTEDGSYRFDGSHELPPSWASGNMVRLKVLDKNRDKLYGGYYALA